MPRSSNMDIQFIPTIRGGINLIVENYKFRLKRKVEDKVYWACVSTGCKSNCVTRRHEEMFKVSGCRLFWHLILSHYHSVSICILWVIIMTMIMLTVDDDSSTNSKCNNSKTKEMIR